MKFRSLVAVLTTGLTLVSTTPALAQTSNAALLQQLQEQIALLQAKIEAAKQAEAQVGVAASNVAGTLKLIAQLREGSSGEQVSILQAILAANPEIYPEGRVTGFYGALTKKAVARFQKLNNLEQVGNVGPKTLAKLNQELNKNPIAKNNSSSTPFCAIVPPGHLIAKGWLKKNAAPIVPACQTLPPGIMAKLGGVSTSTDQTAPTLGTVSMTGITTSTIRILWTTNEASNSFVWYSTTSPIVATSTTPSAGSSALVTSHDVQVTGLTTNTTYYFVVTSVDAAGNLATSSQSSFTTAAVTDITAPSMTSIYATGMTGSSAHITWTTDEAATSIVNFGTTSPVTSSNSTVVSLGTLVNNHDLFITGLSSNTTYYFTVTSADAWGNVATSAQMSFATTAPADVTGPVISAISLVDLSPTSTRVTWTTNELATSYVRFGTATPITTVNSTQTGNSLLSTSHDLMLSGLSTGTVYYYIITSQDNSSNTTNTVEASFTTP